MIAGLVLLLGLLAPAMLAPGQGRASSPALAASLASFDEAWQTINDTYYDPKFGGLDWKAVRAELRPKAEAATSADEIRQLIREMLGRLKQSHFVLMSATSTADTLPGPAAVAVDLRVAEPDVVITQVTPKSPAERAGLRAGDVLLAVDAHTSAEWVKAGAAAPPNARARALEIWHRAYRDLHGATGSTAVVRVRSHDGGEREVRVSRSVETGQTVAFGNLPPMQVRVESTELMTPRKRRVGLIGFNIWMTAVDAPFAQAVDKFRTADGLVIDLRGNAGGLAGMMVGLAGHLIKEPKLLGTMQTRDRPLVFKVNPRLATDDGRSVQPFAGPVAILVDELSASATECFAGALQSLGRVRVFGRQTMGQALPAMTRRLPSGDVLMYVLGDFVTSTGQRLEGQGVIPDEIVPLSIAGLSAGRDATLDAALAWMDKAPLALRPPLLLSSSDLHVRNSTRVRRTHLTQELAAPETVIRLRSAETGAESEPEMKSRREYRMEQRPLRLGDIVDDYCPRERRITNHAIVALVGEAIRQTRCTTCDADHIYKGAKMPRRKKSDAPAALYDQVLAEAAPAQLVPPSAKTDENVSLPPVLAAVRNRSDDPGVSHHSGDDGRAGQRNGSDPEPEPAQPDDQPDRPDEAWAAHRPLIRATLPRTEGEPPTPRPIPEFTMHQRRTRGAHAFRQGWQANGNQRQNNGFRHGRPDHGQGQGHGNGPSHNRHESGGRAGRRHGPKNKRSR